MLDQLVALDIFIMTTKLTKILMKLMYSCYAINQEHFHFKAWLFVFVCITLNKTTLVSHGLSDNTLGQSLDHICQETAMLPTWNCYPDSMALLWYVCIQDHSNWQPILFYSIKNDKAEKKWDGHHWALSLFLWHLK